jgi:hypothetical protein
MGYIWEDGSLEKDLLAGGGKSLNVHFELAEVDRKGPEKQWTRNDARVFYKRLVVDVQVAAVYQHSSNERDHVDQRKETLQEPGVLVGQSYALSAVKGKVAHNEEDAESHSDWGNSDSLLCQRIVYSLPVDAAHEQSVGSQTDAP